MSTRDTGLLEHRRSYRTVYFFCSFGVWERHTLPSNRGVERWRRVYISSP